MDDYTDIDRLHAQTCDEEVTRRSELEPCERTAVAVRIDPNEGKPYAVCAAHARGEMVPLAPLLAELQGLRTEVDQLRGEIAATNVYGRFNGRDWLAGFDATTARRAAAAVVGAEEPTEQAEAQQ